MSENKTLKQTEPSTTSLVNGYNVRYVQSGFNGVRTGTFLQTDKKEWLERSKEQNKITFKFTETNRDEWSVYLYDPTRNVRLQLDLWTKKIYYSDSNTPRRELYQILNVLD